jgi:hypothetical protein
MLTPPLSLYTFTHALLAGRPAANADPYVVTAKIFITTCLE